MRKFALELFAVAIVIVVGVWVMLGELVTRGLQTRPPVLFAFVIVFLITSYAVCRMIKSINNEEVGNE